jgi:hypothetical protein
MTKLNIEVARKLFMLKHSINKLATKLERFDSFGSRTFRPLPTGIIKLSPGEKWTSMD